MNNAYMEYDRKLSEARFHAHQQSCTVEEALMVEMNLTQHMQYCIVDGPILTVYSLGCIPGHPSKAYDINDVASIQVRVEKWPDEVYEHIYGLGLSHRMVYFRPETIKAL